MTGFELDGRSINVREDVQEKGRREARRQAGGAELKQPWLEKEWRRVAGSGDAESGAAGIDESAVGELIASRDAAREARDYEKADGILTELTEMGVGLDDGRRQRAWWLGKRADGRGGEGGRRGAGSGASRGRREWYNDGGGYEDGDGYGGGGYGGGGYGGAGRSGGRGGRGGGY